MPQNVIFLFSFQQQDGAFQQRMESIKSPNRPATGEGTSSWRPHQQNETFSFQAEDP